MSKKDRLSGNEAVAIAMRQINPDVMPAFPITPSTEIPQYFCNFIANGQVDTEFIPVESEHSAMSACIGASAAGARVVTATSSCGMAYMWEELHVAASDRLPIVMSLVNRALSGPININADHSDAMGAKDTGWIQIFAENNQEAYDNFIQAYPIAEDERVHLPLMVCQDGFITSHAVENIVIEDDVKVKRFVGEYEPEHYLLNENEPLAVGPYSVTNYYFEARRAQDEAMRNVPQVVKEVAERFEATFGRKYGFFEEYRMEDAEYAIVIMGSAAGTMKYYIDKFRENGEKIGLIKIRMFRPFPARELAQALSGVKAVAVMDRAQGFSNAGGPMGAEVVRALYYGKSQAEVINYIYGLGGRDLLEEHAEEILESLKDAAKNGHEDLYRYIGVRGRD
ncbi:MAG: pyruvate ferredoxin oxidoreductase [Eubacterium sp.]|nr:pyruvate ferredoxin oxidoreductase [Eubacterium sp.]